MYQLAKGVLRRFSTMRSYKDKLIFFYWWLLFQLRNSLSGSKVAPRDAGIDPSRSYQVTPESIRAGLFVKTGGYKQDWLSRRYRLGGLGFAGGPARRIHNSA